MVARNKILTEVYNDKVLIRTCKKLYKSEWEEAMHDLIGYLSSMTSEQLTHLKETNIIGYCRRTLFNKKLQASSLNLLRAQLSDDIPTAAPPDQSDHRIKVSGEIYAYLVEQSRLPSPHFYDPLLFLEYLRAGSMGKLAQETNIPKVSIYNSITRYKKNLQEKFKCNLFPKNSIKAS